MICACFHARTNTALRLLEAGAALNQVNNAGKSALDCAHEKGLAAVSSAIYAWGGCTAAVLKASAGDAAAERTSRAGRAFRA
jgi:hypothetical protein